MSDRLDEVLKHRYVYVPRGETKDTLQPGKLLGLAVARARRVPLTVLAPQKNSATFHDELAKLEIVTERSGQVSDGGVVLAWCPRFKTMEKAQHLEQSVVILVEWIPGEFEGWAKLNQAYNVVTGKVMDAALTPAAVEALDRLVFEGYKGWTDSISARMVTSYLTDLADAGAYDRNIVLAYARQTKHEGAIERLQKIMDAFEAPRLPPSESELRQFRTSRRW
ncbi:hypothetical protein [Pimelobacter simplex]|uniref:hypothetical protein n=1 Tax=Nocardioides simplex TaxID=2045 RepID=UPI00214FD0C9|nr:hypothetical protein [Pimelobacter simplex]UUW88646.1 hypothetical protein M0M43_23320 [Pimelobacter simplex]UUW98151.1 hypothetical protein M0M48_11970 [Pimelobacter simplex]